MATKKSIREFVNFHLIGDAKIPYPKSVFFIVTNEFCERFSYYGLRTILVLYCNYILGFSTDTSTVIYHVFIMFAYFFPIIGAIIADSFLGKFRTILYLSIVYALGNIVVSIAAIGELNLPQSELTMVGLLLIAFGTGGIKPCVSAFGGDQFVVPQQDVQLQKFFSFFYFAINAGSFISTFLTPVLREDVHCFGLDSCFFAAFGVPAVLMVVSIVVFVLGSRMYKMKAPEGNLIVKVSSCMWYAVTKKSKDKREHWLDKADDKFDKVFIDDIKSALKVLVLYIPLPIFWALFDQQGSRWTFQAARMSGDLGNNVIIKPDQMQVVNPVLILVFIPLFETVVYPLLAKVNLLKRPLQKLVVGGVFAAVAFLISAAVEFELQTTYPVLPSDGLGQLRIYNALPCNIAVDLQNKEMLGFNLEALAKWENKSIPVANSFVEFQAIWKGDCNSGSATIKAYNDEATSYTITSNGVEESRQENVDKSDNGDPLIMIIYSSVVATDWKAHIEFSIDGDVEYETTLNSTTSGRIQPFEKISIGQEYKVSVNNKTLDGTLELRLGGGYTLVIVETKENEYEYKIHQITEPNSMNMLWLIPQYAVLTAGEVMFSVTGLEFSYTQSPLSMKSLITSAWLLAVAIGNLVVVIVAEAEIFESQAYEFLLFAGLMLLDMLIFALMAMRYKYVETAVDRKEAVTDDEQNGNDIPLEKKN